MVSAVDGMPTANMELEELSTLVVKSGEESTELTIHREGEDDFTVELTSARINVKHVEHFLYNHHTGYIRISMFSGNCAEEFREAVKDLTDRNMTSLVVDLRNNPGGLLDQAVSVSDAFLNKGVIVSMRGRQEETAREFVAKPQDTDIIDTPLVVLVNGGSASASEIVAGALGDQKRALLVGERTFGKGSVQNIIPLSDGSGLKLTVALYYTPSGRSIQAEGIMPDLEVPFEAPKEKPAPLSSLRMIREKDLNKHLEKTDGDKGKASGKKVETPAPAANEPLPDAKEFLERDNQLRMSLQFVKSLPKIRTIH